MAVIWALAVFMVITATSVVKMMVTVRITVGAVTAAAVMVLST